MVKRMLWLLQSLDRFARYIFLGNGLNRVFSLSIKLLVATPVVWVVLAPVGNELGRRVAAVTYLLSLFFLVFPVLLFAVTAVSHHYLWPRYKWSNSFLRSYR